MALPLVPSFLQAVWRGFALRKRLAAALAQAQCFHPGDHEAFEEVDVDEFVFDEVGSRYKLHRLTLSGLTGLDLKPPIKLTLPPRKMETGTFPLSPTPLTHPLSYSLGIRIIKEHCPLY